MSDSVQAMTASRRFKTRIIAHSGPIRVLVNEQPIRSKSDADHLIEVLRARRAFYGGNGKYEKESDRARVSRLFDKAIAKLAKP